MGNPVSHPPPPRREAVLTCHFPRGQFCCAGFQNGEREQSEESPSSNARSCFVKGVTETWGPRLLGLKSVPPLSLTTRDPERHADRHNTTQQHKHQNKGQATAQHDTPHHKTQTATAERGGGTDNTRCTTRGRTGMHGQQAQRSTYAEQQQRAKEQAGTTAHRHSTTAQENKGDHTTPRATVRAGGRGAQANNITGHAWPEDAASQGGAQQHGTKLDAGNTTQHTD